MIYILIFLAILVVIVIIKNKIKQPKLGNMVMVNGAVKAGKTTMAVYLARKIYRQHRFRWRVRCFFCKLFRQPTPEMPLLYSNIPLKIDGYTPLTKDLLLRKTRFAYKSVIYVCESSLVADSMLYSDQDINDNLLLLNKLIAHETHGGYIIYDTQSILDNHFAVKRCIGTYLYVHHTIKFLPFFLLSYVREMAFMGENSTSNISQEDFETGLKLVIIPKKVWKAFDCYCYSSLTDDNPVQGEPIKPDTLKVKEVLTLRKEKHGKKT